MRAVILPAEAEAMSFDLLLESLFRATGAAVFGPSEFNRCGTREPAGPKVRTVAFHVRAVVPEAGKREQPSAVCSGGAGLRHVEWLDQSSIHVSDSFVLIQFFRTICGRDPRPESNSCVGWGSRVQ